MTTMVQPDERQAMETDMGIERAGPSHVTTTLYDLITAMQAIVEPDHDPRLVATVVHWLRSGRITWRGTARGFLMPGCSEVAGAESSAVPAETCRGTA